MAKKATTNGNNNTQLDELNALRRQLSMVPLNKLPEGDLDARIAKLRQRVERDPIAQAQGAPASPVNEGPVVPVAPPVKPKKVKSDIGKSTPEDKSTKAEAKSTSKADGNAVRLGDICQRLKVDGRIARVKLRKAGDKVPSTIGDAWLWDARDVAAVEAIITAAKAA